MKDEIILEVQKWLNTTYTGVDGYTPVTENGTTGWETVYGLIEGLQHELNISPVVPSFGETTLSDYDQLITPNWGSGLSSNVIRLIQGAFWCKGMPQGIGPGAFDGIYSAELAYAVTDFKTQAGFSDATEVLEGLWAKALFDMAQFVLIDDPKIRQMQQYLNLNYYDYTGILPTDGIYQRATNEAIVYGMQKELGISADDATGYFGSSTSSLYKEAYAQGLNSELIMLVQFAIYANMIEFWTSGGGTPISFTGLLDEGTTSAIREFQLFMQLEPVDDASPDLRTVLSLVQSNGDWTRDFIGSDTALQLTDQQVVDLLDFGVYYIGRYLTGTVGDNFIPKFLTIDEAKIIFNHNMKIIPIYQDNYPSADYYSYDQGLRDARAAIYAAGALGIPDGSFIYFAVDFDAQGQEIQNNVISYFLGVQKTLGENIANLHYQAGVYGTRNVCTQIHNQVGIQRSYVANMSSGWSGNLGFSQPLDWAFDQFYEYSTGSVTDFDFVAVSGLDEAVGALDKPIIIDPDYWINQTNWDWLKNLKVTVDGPSVKLIDNPALTIEVSEHSEVQETDGSAFTLDITSGELSAESADYIQKILGIDIGPVVTSTINDFSVGISSAKFSISVTIDAEGKKGWKFVINFPESSTDDIKITSSVEIDITFDFNSQSGDGALDTALKSLENALLAIAGVGVAFLIACLIIEAAPVEGLAAIGAVIIAILTKFGQPTNPEK